MRGKRYTRRKRYDLFGRPLAGLVDFKQIAYVDCDCGHRAIRQKAPISFFRCSLCKKEYGRIKGGRIVERQKIK